MQHDATSLTPNTARIIYLQGEAFSREGLETAWLLLQEADGARIKAAVAMEAQGWVINQAVAFVEAAQRWTGNVVSSTRN